MVSTTSNVLATIGTVCWCVQLLPQIYVNYRKKNTEGFPELMALLWCLCAPFFAVFVVTENESIPIMLQPHLFGFFCWIVYIQIMYYPPVARTKKEIVVRAGGFLLFQIILEVSCIIPLRKLYIDGTCTWPPLIFGILASITLAIGLIPPYFELWKRQGRVVGINFLFLLVDFSGAIFSLASLAVDPEDIDIMGLVVYTICAALEFGIFLSQFIWLIRFRLFKTSSKTDLEDGLDSESESESELENQAATIYGDSDDDNDPAQSVPFGLGDDMTKSKLVEEKTNEKDMEDKENDSDDLTPFQTLV